MKSTRAYRIPLLLGLLAAAAVLPGCNTAPARELSCVPPQGTNLDAAFAQTRQDLAAGCATHFDGYLTRLLAIAQGDPQPENKRRFSDFLVWANEQSLLSRRQAQAVYNRYFNVKFVALSGDYNTCSQICPTRERVMRDMEQELRDKERGLLQISRDRESYYRADRLYHEAELVLQATCTACAER